MKPTTHKLRARATALLGHSRYTLQDTPAIALLVDFAAQNSGMEWSNYGGDGQAYRQEARSITADWQRFVEAFHIAAGEGVQDADVIAEAPHAFSGRLEWKARTLAPIGSQTFNGTACLTSVEAAQEQPARWSYCTGQYFPTEYRKAAATLLEAAIRRVRQARPAKARTVSTIAELKALNEQNGGTWFDRSNMRFFRTRIESGILSGCYFITSEQREDSEPRKFTVRSFDAEGGVNTIGEFHAHRSKQDAKDALKEHLAGAQTIAA